MLIYTLVTYNGSHAEMEERERGPEGGASRKILASHALQIPGKYEAEKVVKSRLFRKLTATQKYNVLYA